MLGGCLHHHHQKNFILEVNEGWKELFFCFVFFCFANLVIWACTAELLVVDQSVNGGFVSVDGARFAPSPKLHYPEDARERIEEQQLLSVVG